MDRTQVIQSKVHVGMYEKYAVDFESRWKQRSVLLCVIRDLMDVYFNKKMEDCQGRLLG